MDLRRCRVCGGGQMQPERIEWNRTGNRWHYRCPDCGHALTLEPPGQAAGTLSMGLLVTLGAILLFGLDDDADWSTWAALSAFGVLALWFPGRQLLLHRRYPITAQADISLPQDRLDDPLQRGIAAGDRMSVAKGLLSPLLIIFLVMAVAVLIGLFLNP